MFEKGGLKAAVQEKPPPGVEGGIFLFYYKRYKEQDQEESLCMAVTKTPSAPPPSVAGRTGIPLQGIGPFRQHAADRAGFWSG